MKNKSLKQMKKALLGIFAVAIVGLAVANVSLALNGEGYIVNMSLTGTESLAKNEYGGGSGCYQNADIWEHTNTQGFELWCTSGDEIFCESGHSYYCDNGYGWWQCSHSYEQLFCW